MVGDPQPGPLSTEVGGMVAASSSSFVGSIFI